MKANELRLGDLLRVDCKNFYFCLILKVTSKKNYCGEDTNYLEISCIYTRASSQYSDHVSSLTFHSDQDIETWWHFVQHMPIEL